ncbi:Uncharacterised protein [Actinobacillus equuli]|nr:Uncharacterised protein [Actinobacillus equuli]
MGNALYSNGIRGWGIFLCITCLSLVPKRIDGIRVPVDSVAVILH